MEVDVTQIDYRNPTHGQALIQLLKIYALDPMGGGEPLGQDVVSNLVERLAKLPQAFSVVAWVNGDPAGLVNCFEGFSTFTARPLVNIHDVVVAPEFRGQGLSKLMLQEVERLARQRGCCKLTLEVLEGNRTAQRAYASLGFAGYQLDASMGSALFWQKTL